MVGFRKSGHIYIYIYIYIYMYMYKLFASWISKFCFVIKHSVKSTVYGMLNCFLCSQVEENQLTTVLE